MHPIDPGSHWLEAGITGLPRQKEWDAVATSDAPGTVGDEVEFVALSDGRLLVGAGPTMKRFQTRAKGSAFSINKRTSHVRVTLSER